MTTYAKSTTALTAVRARLQSWPMAWQDAAGVANSLAGCTVTTRVTFHPSGAVISLAIGTGITIVDSTGGTFTVDLTALQLADLPDGQLSDVTVEIVDGASVPHVFYFPLTGKLP